MLKSVICFIDSIREKLNCKVNLVLVSSDHKFEDYRKLLAKFASNDFFEKKAEKRNSIFALDFKAANIKETLFKFPTLNKVSRFFFSC